MRKPGLFRGEFVEVLMEVNWKKVQRLQMRGEDRLPTEPPDTSVCPHTSNDIMLLAWKHLICHVTYKNMQHFCQRSPHNYLSSLIYIKCLLIHHDCCSAQSRAEMKGRRQGSLSDGGEVQVVWGSWDEESRKRRGCLTVGGEGEDSGCQIGSPRLWNLQRSYTNKHKVKKSCVRER